MLESAHTMDPDLNPSMQVPRCDWEEYIVRLASEITAEQSPQKLLQAREMMYELLTNCIPAGVIMRTLVKELMKNTDDSLKHEIVKHAAYYEARLNGGSKEIFHLEAFVAKFMACYKEYLTNLFG
jgi:replication factor C subunit 3/5